MQNNSKLYGVMCYLNMLIIVPALFGMRDSYVRFHINQGLLLVVANIIFNFVGILPNMYLPAAGLNILVFIFSILGVINAWKGEMKELPIIGKIRLLR